MVPMCGDHLIDMYWDEMVGEWICKWCPKLNRKRQPWRGGLLNNEGNK